MEGNILILGGPSAGKTYKCRQILSEVLASGGKAIALGWHGEYRDLPEQYPDRLTCIGTGDYSEATPDWLADQLTHLTELLPANLVVVEADGYLNDTAAQAVLPLACRIRADRGRVLITSQTVQPFTTQAGKHLLGQMRTVQILQLRGPDADEAAMLLGLSTEQVSLLARGGSVTISAS